MLADVNVLVYAFAEESVRHEEYRAWLEGAANGDESLVITDQVAASFIRIVTHRRIFKVPAPAPRAVEFLRALRLSPAIMSLQPSGASWAVFEEFCVLPGVHGDVVPDAYIAAVASASGCEVITADAGFARFPGVRWRDPVA
jgi:toxin-antitoxin system PIN domain toxin